MNKVIEKCKNTRILAILGIVGLILGTITPYVSYNIFGYKYSITLWGYWQGKVIMLLAIINLLFIFKDIVENYIPKLFNSNIGIKIKECKNPKFSLILTVLIAILAIVLTSIVGVSAFRYYNIGFYLIWIGIICLIAYAFLYKAETNN